MVENLADYQNEVNTTSVDLEKHAEFRTWEQVNFCKRLRKYRQSGQ